MKNEREKIGLLLAAACALGASSAVSADDLSVMAIGDSLTWGFSYEGPDGVLGNADDGGGASWFASNGGWRSPLNAQLNSNATLDTTYNFIGTKGDDVATTVFNEASGVVDDRGDAFMAGNGYADGDGFDGPGSAAALHEGYGGWVTQDIRDNISSDGSTGPIQPGSADVVMIMVGVNDVLGLDLFPSGTYANTSEIVDDLALLIDEIVAIAPDATILVSNVLPVVTNSRPFLGLDDPTDQTNDYIDDLNDELLLDEFGNAWLDDSEGTDVYAEHDTYDNVFLLNANSVIDPSAGAGDIYTIHSDYIHLTPQGYGDLANFYEDRFVGLNIVPEPSSAALLAVLGGMAMVRRRRRA